MKQIKTIKALALELCRREKKKKQVDIAQMSETIGHLSDLLAAERSGMESKIFTCLYINGLKRAKKKAKSCRK